MTGSKKRQFAINAASGFIDQIVRIVVGFVMLKYLMARLGLEVYGISQLAQSMLVFFYFLQLGMSPSLLRFGAQAIAQNDREQLHKISSTAQAILGTLGLVGMVLMMGSIPVFLDFYNIPAALTFGVSVLLVCLAFSLLLNFVSFVPHALVLGCNRYDWANSVGIAVSLLRFGLVVLAFEWLGPSLLLLGVCILLSLLFRVAALFVLSLIYVGRVTFPVVRAINRETLKSLLSFSVLNLLGSLAMALTVRGSVLIIGKTLGSEAVALFSPAILVANAMQGLLVQISSPLVPLASRAREENNMKKMGSWSIMIGGFVATVSLAVVLPLCIFGKEVLLLWLGADMMSVWKIVAVMTLGAGISQIAMVNYNLSLGGGNIRPFVFSVIVLGVIASAGTAVGTIFLDWHLLAVAIFIAVCRCLHGVIYMTYAYSKQFFYSIPRYLWNVYAKSLFVFLGALGVGVALKMWVDVDPYLTRIGAFLLIVLLTLQCTIVLGVYSGLAWCFVIAAEIKHSLHRLLPWARKSS